MTKQVQLSERAYEVLRAHKREGESFSATVIRLCTKKDPLGLVGAKLSSLSREERLRIAEQMKGPRL